MNTKMSRRSFVSTAAVATTGLALAACGISSTASEGDASTELTPITFCLDYTPNTNHTGIYVAQQKGFFAEEGLDVTIVQPAESTAEALIGTGQAQLGVSYQDYIASALVGGNEDILAVAAIIQHNTSGIMSRADDGITSAAKMEGHTYATWDLPVEQATIRQVMESDGADYSKLKLVPYTVDDDVAGLKAGMYDCVWVYEGWAVQSANLQDYEVNFFSFASMDSVFDFYSPVIAANARYARENPDVVKAFVRAVKRGYELAIKSPEEAADLLIEAVPELDADLVHASADFLADQYQADAASWGVIDGDRWAAYFQWLNDNKLVEPALDVDSCWSGDYLEA